MKNLIYSVFILIGFTLPALCQEERDIIAVPGSPGNSHIWHPQINVMKSEGWQIREVFSPSLFDRENSTISENVINLLLNVNHPLLNCENVLGLGHDVGGLAIRGLRQETDLVTGQILIGTPNQGSSFLYDLNYGVSGDETSIESWLKDLNEWKGDIECPDCNLPEALLSFVERIKQKPYSLGAVDEPLAYFNTLPAPDPTTTAVIWGDATGQSLGDLVGASTSSFGGSSFHDFEECANVLRAFDEAALENDIIIRDINRVTSFYTRLLDLIGVLNPLGGDGDLNVGDFLGNLSEWINDTADDIIQDIEASEEINQKQREILICELANQRLQAEWLLRVHGGTFEMVETSVEHPLYDAALCQTYTFQCQYNTYHPNHASFCYYADLYCLQQVQTFVYEASDFIFTETEQKISGIPSSQTFRIEANHLEEQRFSKNRVPLEHLFFGNEGPAFNVPLD